MDDNAKELDTAWAAAVNEARDTAMCQPEGVAEVEDHEAWAGQMVAAWVSNIAHQSTRIH